MPAKLTAAALMFLPVISCAIWASSEGEESRVLDKPAQTAFQQKGKQVLKSGEYEALWETLNEADKYLRSILAEPDDLALSHEILQQDCHYPTSLVSKADYLDLHADEIKARNGLTLRGRYANRGFAGGSEEDTSYLELDWDLVRNGYLENKKRAISERTRAKVSRLNEQIQHLTKRNRCRRYQLSESFVGTKAALLASKLKLMEQVNEIERRAYFKGWSYLDDAFKGEVDLRLINAELDYLHSNEAYDQYITIPLNPPIVDLDMAMIADAIRNDRRFHKAAALQKEQIRREQQARQPNRFQLFARKNMNASLSDAGEGVSVGLRFSVPLEKKQNKAVTRYNLLKADEDLVLSKWERLTRIRSAAAQLFEQKERTISQQYRFLTAKERMRRTFVSQRLDGDTEVALAVIRMRSYIQSAIELIKAKEELYRRINEVFLVARLEYKPEYIFRASVATDNYRSRVGRRSIYLWSSLFNSWENEQLLDVAEAKGISHLILSMGRKTKMVKAKRLINLAGNRGITVSTMVGANEWIYPENHQRAALTVAAAAELTGKVHLDIEPHTLPNYKKNKDKYLANYIGMLKYIKRAIADHHLSVAVPTHWPKEIYKQTAANSDHVYIMSYETNNIETQVRRITKVINELTRATVVLSIKDYPDEWALEGMIEALNTRLHLDEFALHKMADFFAPQGDQ